MVALIAIVGTVALIAAASHWVVNRQQHEPENSGLYAVEVDGKHGFMDRTGRIVIAPQFDGVGEFSEGFAAIQVGTKFGYIDTEGSIVVAPQFDRVGQFSEGMAAVQVGDKYGFINTRGIIAITPQFMNVTQFHEGRATVRLAGDPRLFEAAGKIGQPSNERYGFIDREGRYIGRSDLRFVPWRFGDAYEWTGDVTLVRTAEDQIGLMNRAGQVSILPHVDQVIHGFTEGLAPAAVGGEWGYLDETGQWAIQPQFEQAFGFSEGFASVEVGGRWGVINKHGRFVINPQYDLVSGFSEGYAAFRTGEGTIQGCDHCSRNGFLNTRGEIVVEATFMDRPDGNSSWSSPIGGFHEGLATVRTDDGWGYVDATGRMVIPPQFDAAGAFQGGLAPVRALGKRGYITRTGEFVLAPFPGTTVLEERARIAAEESRAPSPGSFAGVWWLESGGYLKISEGYNGQLQLAEGRVSGWRLVWNDNVGVDFVDGKLEGQFASYNFRASGGGMVQYQLTLELLPNGRLHYSISSDLGNEVRTATKVPPNSFVDHA